MPTDPLAITAERRDLQNGLRDLLGDVYDRDARRKSVEFDTGFDTAVWKTLAAGLGLAAISVPEEYGGLGLTESDWAAAHEELGRVLYSGPALGAHLATSALVSAAPSDQRASWLAAIASGEALGTVALTPRHAAQGPTVRAERRDGSWRLTGHAPYVPYGDVADVLMIPASTTDGNELFLVERQQDTIHPQTLNGLDLTRRISRITLDQAPAWVLSPRDDEPSPSTAVRRSFLLAMAAEASGGLRWCLDTCVEHAKTRKQFSHPIGTFQAVAHACVDMLRDANFAHAASRYAAAAATSDQRDSDASLRVAALRNGLAYREVTETAIHILGGLGFTWEHDAHLYYRRSWSNLELSGGPAALRLSVAEAIGA